MTKIFSEVLTLRDSKGGISNSPNSSARVTSSSGRIAIDTAILLGDFLYFIDIPSSAVINKLKIYNDDLDSGATLNLLFGIYAGAKFVLSSGDTVLKDDSLVTNAFSSYSGATDSNVPEGSSIRFDSTGGSSSLDRSSQALWELADLSTDPFVNLRIGAAPSAEATGFLSGNILLTAQWLNKH